MLKYAPIIHLLSRFMNVLFLPVDCKNVQIQTIMNNNAYNPTNMQMASSKNNFILPTLNTLVGVF